jgi:hypothetical protein
VKRFATTAFTGMASRRLNAARRTEKGKLNWNKGGR